MLGCRTRRCALTLLLIFTAVPRRPGFSVHSDVNHTRVATFLTCAAYARICSIARTRKNMIRQRSAAPGIIARPKYIYAKFEGYCKCGKRIYVGDLMCYDPIGKLALCVQCAKKRSKLAASGLSEVEPVNEGQELIDHINRLRALPTPLDESVTSKIAALEQQLREHARSDWALRLRLLKSNAKGSVKPISAKFAGKCFGCHAEQTAGEPVAYDTVSKKIYCYLCV